MLAMLENNLVEVHNTLPRSFSLHIQALIYHNKWVTFFCHNISRFWRITCNIRGPAHLPNYITISKLHVANINHLFTCHLLLLSRAINWLWLNQLSIDCVVMVDHLLPFSHLIGKSCDHHLVPLFGKSL